MNVNMNAAAWELSETAVSPSLALLHLGGGEIILILVMLGLGAAAVAAIVIGLIISGRKRHSSAPPGGNAPARDIEQELRTLARLKDQALINDEEYKLKKKAILGI